MPTRNPPAPRTYQGVMVSSTFTDLVKHRAALIRAIKCQGFTDVAMENDTAKADVDVIDSSLRMVQDAAAYVGVISHKYGQTPACPTRNPQGLSITELEFNEAQRLGRPILLFIMSINHKALPADIETDPVKRKKLDAFRERAKPMGPDTTVHRVYSTFNSLAQFKEQTTNAMAGLRRFLDEKAAPVVLAPPAPTPPPAPAPTAIDPIPTPPAFYAEPAYIGSHKFVGRQAELERLSDWAMPADPHPVLLFDAIGGSGKSMLTWEWTTKDATRVRGDWAGRCWYSFYERGAVMADFCRRALAYMTGQPLSDLRKMKTPELGERLLHQLQAHPWLLVLDGLERVLVAYHRIDAAQVLDEEANRPTDPIAHRDPCAAIRPEDEDLLRGLAAAAPSKLLVTSRLVPRVFLNSASQPIPGVLRVSLPGLRPADAEALLRSCGVSGDVQAIQNYLKSHCDCHPLVTGVLAGLINNYLPDRGNFDVWVADAAGGGQLNLAKLDLIQKRNHILKAALDALSEKSRQLLCTLAILSEAVDSLTLHALNPHLPPEPEEVEAPQRPEESYRWRVMSRSDKRKAQREYEAARKCRKQYEHAVEVWRRSPEVLAAPRELADTVHDLERRGLLQYDRNSKRYDLHPVVRGIASGGLRAEETNRYGQRVVDHFSQQPHNPYDEAETLEDLRDGLHVVRTLLKMGRYQQACDAYRGELAVALFANLEAHANVLPLLRPFFPHGWGTEPDVLRERSRGYLANEAAVTLKQLGEPEEALAAFGAAILMALARKAWTGTRVGLSNVCSTLVSQNRLASAERFALLALDLADVVDNKGDQFRARLDRFVHLAQIGRWADAEDAWQLLDPMGRDWPRAMYRPGDAEYGYARFRFWRGDLAEEHLARAEQLARGGKNRAVIRSLHGLRGEWWLEQGRWALAAESLHEAVRMAREVGRHNGAAETQLALAKFHDGQLAEPHAEAERLAEARWRAQRSLAELWLAVGEPERAKKHALAAYRWAWADGEPYVNRYALTKTTALLEKLGEEIPNLPPYDPAKDRKLPWEDRVAAAIEKLRAEKAAKGKEAKPD